MEKEIGYAIKTTIEIFIASMILLIVTPLCILGYRAYGLKLQDDAHQAKMTRMAELYAYNNKQVSYFDAMELIMVHTRTYDYIFTSGDLSDPDATVVLNYDAEMKWAQDNNKNSLQFWDYTNILEMTDAFSDANLKATLITSSDGEQVLGVRFTVGG